MRRRAERENEVLGIVDELLTGESIPDIPPFLVAPVCQSLVNLRKEAARNQNVFLRRKIDCILPEIKAGPARTVSRKCDVIVSNLFLGTIKPAQVPPTHLDDVKAECARLQIENQRQMKTADARRFKRLCSELAKIDTSACELEEVSNLWKAYKDAMALKKKIIDTFQSEKERIEGEEEAAELNIVQVFSGRNAKGDERARFIPSRHLVELRLAVEQMRKAKQVEDARITERHMKRVEAQERDAFAKKNQLAEAYRRRTRDGERIRKLSEMRAFWQEKKDLNYARAVKDVTRVTHQLATLARKLQERGYRVSEDGENLEAVESQPMRRRKAPAILPVSFRRPQKTHRDAEDWSETDEKEKAREIIKSGEVEVSRAPVPQLSESSGSNLSYSELSSSDSEEAETSPKRARLDYNAFLHKSPDNTQHEEEYEYEYVSVVDEQTEINLKSETDKSATPLATETEYEYEYVSMVDEQTGVDFKTESEQLLTEGTESTSKRNRQTTPEEDYDELSYRCDC